MVPAVLTPSTSRGKRQWWSLFPALAVPVVLASVIALDTMQGRALRPASDSELTSAGMTLAGADDFDGPPWSAPDRRYWDYDTGAGGWGNDEQQTYTNSTGNARLDGSGNLIIEARRNGNGFTSARLVSRNRVDIGFGLLEARIRMPEGQGIHPAFWLLGTNIWTAGWPQSGELDVMELVNSGTSYHNAIHGPTVKNPEEAWKQSADGDAGVNLAQDYHVYQILRAPGTIKVALDGDVVGSYSKTSAPAGADWVFDKPMYVVLNVAVGGDWPGPVAAETRFPATMVVDWIRYWV
ncbi:MULTISPECIES: glycoside hydrolase family 16 protein [unclassified Mycobacterium]|uniref:glycoside hydrolase family 16 protein n=1 Tax=unclassified Mycobacterium TaxID=2642494 RepID=UPI0029C85723|nr:MULTISPECIES: glycoside hydrolase family 16 protein [unclassified Mycobacterium]